MTDDALVIFTPSGKRGRFALGTPVLTAARQLGVDLDSVCGGRGICSKCQITPSYGDFPKHGVTVADGALTEWNSVEGTLRLANPANTDDIVKMFELKHAGKHARVNVKLVSDKVYHISIDSLQRVASEQNIDVAVRGKPVGSKKKESFVITLPEYPETEFQVIKPVGCLLHEWLR